MKRIVLTACILCILGSAGGAQTIADKMVSGAPKPGLPEGNFDALY